MKINKRTTGIVLAGLLLIGFLIPVSGQASSVLSPGGQTTIDGRAWRTFTGPDGLRILALSPFPENARLRLERTVNVISSWPSIQITELRAESNKEVDDYVLSFQSLQYKGRDYPANVPGGLRLRFDGALMYDFRVRSSDYFVRVRGVLMDEASLLSEIAKAVQDPGAYIAERDPSWLALRIDQLDKADTQLDQRLTQETAEHTALLRARTSELQARLDTMTADFESSLDQLAQEAEDNRSKLEANLALAEGFRQSLASEMNRGFFGGSKPLDTAVLEQVLSFKASNASADRATALEHAKAMELKPRSKEIDIIFKLWFNE